MVGAIAFLWRYWNSSQKSQLHAQLCCCQIKIVYNMIVSVLFTFKVINLKVENVNIHVIQ